MSENPVTPKAPRDRSPSFPFIPLKSAVERLGDFEEKFGRHPAPANRTYLAWGYKGDTSQAQQTLSALKAFGMVEYQGSGPERLVAMSEDARTYLRANQDSIKKEVLQKLSLRPTEYVQRQIRVTPYPTEDVGWITEQVGPDVCLFSTDFPHVEGGRRPFERFERSLGDVSEHVRNRFYAENFVDLMGRGLPAELAQA